MNKRTNWNNKEEDNSLIIDMKSIKSEKDPALFSFSQAMVNNDIISNDFTEVTLNNINNNFYDPIVNDITGIIDDEKNKSDMFLDDVIKDIGEFPLNENKKLVGGSLQLPMSEAHTSLAFPEGKSHGSVEIKTRTSCFITFDETLELNPDDYKISDVAWINELPLCSLNSYDDEDDMYENRIVFEGSFNNNKSQLQFNLTIDSRLFIYPINIKCNSHCFNSNDFRNLVDKIDVHSVYPPHGPPTK